MKEGTRNSTINTTQYDNLNNVVNDLYTLTGEKRTGYLVDANLNYYKKWKDSKTTLMGDFTFSTNIDDINNFSDQHPITPPNPSPLYRNQTNKDGTNNFIGTIDFTHPLSETNRI